MAMFTPTPSSAYTLTPMIHPQTPSRPSDTLSQPHTPLNTLIHPQIYLSTRTETLINIQPFRYLYKHAQTPLNTHVYPQIHIPTPKPPATYTHSDNLKHH